MEKTCNTCNKTLKSEKGLAWHMEKAWCGKPKAKKGSKASKTKATKPANAGGHEENRDKRTRGAGEPWNDTPAQQRADAKQGGPITLLSGIDAKLDKVLTGIDGLATQNARLETEFVAMIATDAGLEVVNAS